MFAISGVACELFRNALRRAQSDGCLIGCDPIAWVAYRFDDLYSRACGFFFFFQAEDGIRDVAVTGVQTCALPICLRASVVEVLRGGRALDGLESPPGYQNQSNYEFYGSHYHSIQAARDKLRRREGRSEERRVGKECRSRWSPYH